MVVPIQVDFDEGTSRGCWWRLPAAGRPDVACCARVTGSSGGQNGLDHRLVPGFADRIAQVTGAVGRVAVPASLTYAGIGGAKRLSERLREAGHDGHVTVQVRQLIVQIQITDGDGEELAALSEWLGSEDELRGQVRSVFSPIGDTELGSVPELSTVSLGAGGGGTVLASFLKTWLLTRRTRAKITLKAAACGQYQKGPGHGTFSVGRLDPDHDLRVSW
jgi:Effector Associated Constant Component 1